MQGLLPRKLIPSGCPPEYTTWQTPHLGEWVGTVQEGFGWDEEVLPHPWIARPMLRGRDEERMNMAERKREEQHGWQAERLVLRSRDGERGKLAERERGKRQKCRPEQKAESVAGREYAAEREVESSVR